MMGMSSKIVIDCSPAVFDPDEMAAYSYAQRMVDRMNTEVDNWRIDSIPEFLYVSKSMIEPLNVLNGASIEDSYQNWKFPLKWSTDL